MTPTAADVGRPVKIRASGDFYKYIDGRTGKIESFESGHVVVRCPSDEFCEVDLIFVVPPDQLELISDEA